MRTKEEIINKIKELEEEIKKINIKINNGDESFEVLEFWIEKKWLLTKSLITLRYVLGYNDLTIK